MLTASSNITFCRYLHQATTCVLYQHKKDAYKLYCNSTATPVPEAEWSSGNMQHPMFKYWSITLKMELILLHFVKAIRSADFNMYVNALQLIAPWMFSLDHYNYARWLPVHIYSMVTLRHSPRCIRTVYKRLLHRAEIEQEVLAHRVGP